MTGSPMASVFDEILSETVHLRMEPAGTSCSAEAVAGEERETAESGAERRRVSMSLLFMTTPRNSRAHPRSPAAVALATCDAHLASALAPIELPVEADTKSSTIMLSWYCTVNG